MRPSDHAASSQLPKLELYKVFQMMATGVGCDDVLKRLRKILNLPFFVDPIKRLRPPTFCGIAWSWVPASPNPRLSRPESMFPAARVGRLLGGLPPQSAVLGRWGIGTKATGYLIPGFMVLLGFSARPIQGSRAVWKPDVR